MREQVRLGQVFGIEIGMNWSVLVIGALLVFGLAGGASGVAVWATAIVAVGLFFGSLLAHEISHSVIAQHNGVRVQGITLWLLGGVSRLEGTIPSAGAEFRIALAGPAMSLVLAALFFGFSGLASAVGVSALIVSGFLWLALVNGLLAAFNLVPAAPLDGGRVLASVLWAVHHDRTRAEVGATRVGQVVGVGMIIAGIVGALAGSTLGGLWIALLGWFIYSSATAEQRAARTLGKLGDARVGDAMVPLPTLQAGWLTVGAVLDNWRSEPPSTAVVPVQSWSGDVVGLVEVARIRALPPERRSSTRVADLTVPLGSLPEAAPNESLASVLLRSGRAVAPYIVVVDGGSPVGLVGPEQLDRVVSVPRAGSAR